MQIFEYENRKDFVIGTLKTLGGSDISDIDQWTTLLVLGLEKAFFEPILVVIDRQASGPSILARDFVDDEENHQIAQEYFDSCFARNTGKDPLTRPVRYFVMSPKSLFSEDGIEIEKTDEAGYILSEVEDVYVMTFFGGKIEYNRA